VALGGHRRSSVEVRAATHEPTGDSGDARSPRSKRADPIAQRPASGDAGGGRTALLEPIEKGADADLVRALPAFAAERMMAVDVAALTGAPPGVRSAERLSHGNGHRERGRGEEDQETVRWTAFPTNRVGRIDPAIPKLRPRRSADRRCFAIG